MAIGHSQCGHHLLSDAAAARVVGDGLNHHLPMEVKLWALVLEMYILLHVS